MERFVLVALVVALLGSALVAPSVVTASPASAAPASSADKYANEEAILQAYLNDLDIRAKLLRKDAENDIRIMNVAAHPDDEDGASLTFLRRHYGYRTHIVYATRGEGGQNEIGPELGDALGVIRSYECQAAATGYGATISFLNALDFGFCKTADEALERWGFETMVKRMMYEIRRFDPAIILTHHTPDEGHGHHRATSLILREACRRMTEVHRMRPPILLELDSDPESGDGTEMKLVIDSGQPAPDLPWTYAGLAHVALRRHKSQGMGLRPTPSGARAKTYRVVPDIVEHTDWRDDVYNWIHGLYGYVPNEPMSSASIARIDRHFGRGPFLANADRDAKFLNGRRVRGSGLLNQARRIETGSPLIVNNGNGEQVQFLPPHPRISSIGVLGPVPDGMRVTATRPRCSPRTDLQHECWAIEFRNLFAEPNLPREDFVRTRRTVTDSLELEITFGDGEKELRRITIPERPPYSYFVAPTTIPAVVPGSSTMLTVRCFGSAKNTDVKSGALTSRLSPFSPSRAGWSQAQLQLTAPIDARIGAVEVSVGNGGHRRDFTVPVLQVDVPQDMKLGFVAGVDTTTADAMESIGVSVDHLSDQDLATGDLSRYSVICLDIRAYLVREDLKKHNERLHDYVRNGGHLVVNYQKTFEWNDDDGGSPWPILPITLGRGRIVDETAAITRHHEDHPFWSYPHQLEDEDWEGWVQERGLYFPAEWDDGYQSLVSMADPGEGPQHGSLLTARVGQGAYTYTSLVWYRQLRAGVPGAYRAFLNLLTWPLAD